MVNVFNSVPLKTVNNSSNNSSNNIQTTSSNNSSTIGKSDSNSGASGNFKIGKFASKTTTSEQQSAVLGKNGNVALIHSKRSEIDAAVTVKNGTNGGGKSNGADHTTNGHHQKTKKTMAPHVLSIVSSSMSSSSNYSSVSSSPSSSQTSFVHSGQFEAKLISLDSTAQYNVCTSVSSNSTSYKQLPDSCFHSYEETNHNPNSNKQPLTFFNNHSNKNNNDLVSSNSSSQSTSISCNNTNNNTSSNPMSYKTLIRVKKVPLPSYDIISKFCS